MLSHFGNFLCDIAGKGSFKTVLSLWRNGLVGEVFYFRFQALRDSSTKMGKISNRPASISKDRTILLKLLR